MLYARCLSKGANRIGSDLTMGLYSTDEMVDAMRFDERLVKRDDEGRVEEIQDIPHEAA